MKTFSLVAAVVYGIWAAWFLYFMLSTKPKWHKGWFRFVGNWKEGGKYVFWITAFVALLISLVVTGVILTFNFLEK